MRGGSRGRRDNTSRAAQTTQVMRARRIEVDRIRDADHALFYVSNYFLTIFLKLRCVLSSTLFANHVDRVNRDSRLVWKTIRLMCINIYF